jgi:cytochrome b
MAQSHEIKVWDPLVRIFHWSLVAAFTIAFLTEGEDSTLFLHSWAGYTVLGLVLMRLVWGLIGTRHARFTDFVRSPATALAYGKDLLLGRARRYIGHNPAGGLMIMLLLFSLLMTGLMGMALLGIEEQAGPMAGLMAGASHDAGEAVEEIHEFFANATLFLVVIHVLGVLVESLVHRENLVRAMFNGRKAAGENH